MVSHPLSMREALGSIPRLSTFAAAHGGGKPGPENHALTHRKYTPTWGTLLGVDNQQLENDTCGIRTHAGRPHRLSRPTP